LTEFDRVPSPVACRLKAILLLMFLH